MEKGGSKPQPLKTPSGFPQLWRDQEGNESPDATAWANSLTQHTLLRERDPELNRALGGASGAAAGEGTDTSVPSPEAAVRGARASGGPHSPAAHKPATPVARPPRRRRGSWWL